MKRWKIIGVALAFAVCGCKTSIVAPRTGEYFQATRMGPGPSSYAYLLPLFAGAGCVQTGTPLAILGIPLLVVGFPIAGVGFVADVCVFSPVADLICLPYDVCQPNHGFYVRIVDEAGRPLPDVTIEGRVTHGAYEMDADISGKTDEAGEFYVNRLLFKNCWITAHADGRADWRGRCGVAMEDAKPGPDGRYVFTFKMIDDTRRMEGERQTRPEVPQGVELR